MTIGVQTSASIPNLLERRLAGRPDLIRQSAEFNAEQAAAQVKRINDLETENEQLRDAFAREFTELRSKIADLEKRNQELLAGILTCEDCGDDRELAPCTGACRDRALRTDFRSGTES